jgi:hypothetical protein
MAADTISGYIQGLLDGVKFKQTAYALDRDSRKAALARFLSEAVRADARPAGCTSGEFASRDILAEARIEAFLAKPILVWHAGIFAFGQGG